MTTAVVADDWAVVREGVRVLLTEIGLPVLRSTPAATEALRSLVPGTVLIVGSCTDMSLEHAVRRASEAPGVSIVALAGPLDRAGVVRLCAAGAGAVLSRSSRRLDIAASIAQIESGHRYLAPDVLDVVVAAGPHPARPARRAGTLTTRERSVLEHLAAGRTNREIAAALQIGPETVKTHLSNVYVKLGVRNRDQAIAEALRTGAL